MILSHKMIYLVHVLFVAPLLMYSGYVGYNNCSKENSGDHQCIFVFRYFWFNSLLISCFFILQNVLKE